MNRVLGVHIEGLGLYELDGTTGNSNGLMLATDAGLVSSGFQSYDWRSYLVPESVGGGGADIEPILGDVLSKQSPFPFELHAHDVVAELFLGPTYSDKLTTVASDISESATSITLNDSGLSANRAIYLHEETMLITSNDGSGNYTVQRGHYGSSARTHSTDTAVFGQVPFWRQRGVTLYTYDVENDQFEARVSGRIDGSIEQDQTKIIFPVEQGMAGLKSNPLKRKTGGTVRVNRQAHLAEAGLVTFRAGSVTGGTEDRYILSGQMQERSKVVKDDGTGTRPTFWQVEDAIVYVDAPNGTFNKELNILGTELTEPSDPDTVNELFVVDRATDQQRVGNSESRISSTSELASLSSSVTTRNGTSVSVPDATYYPYHILSIVFSVWLSTRRDTVSRADFDILQAPHMGSDLSYLFDDDIAATIHDLIQETGTEAYLVDQEWLGWDADEVDVIEWGKERLKAYGFFVAQNKNGKLDLHRLKTMPVSDFSTAASNALTAIDGEVLLQSGGQQYTLDVVASKVGKSPWSKGRSIYERATDGQAERQSTIVGDADLTLEMPTIKPGNQLLPQKAIDLTLNRARIGRNPPRRVQIAVNDWTLENTDLGIGAPCTINTIDVDKPWLVDYSGTRIKQFTNDTETAGYVIGVDPDHRSGRHVVTIMIFGFVSRLRGSAAKISSYTDNGDGTSTITVPSTSTFGAAQSDDEEFTAGDRVTVWDTDYSIHELTYPEITGVGSDSGTADNSIDLDATFSSAPSAGMWVTLAPWDTDSSGTGWDRASAVTNGVVDYLGLAESDHTLGDAEDDAHQFGG